MEPVGTKWLAPNFEDESFASCKQPTCIPNAQLWQSLKRALFCVQSGPQLSGCCRLQVVKPIKRRANDRVQSDSP